VRTLRVYPQTINLSEDCAAALFSLVFNRGASLTGERRAEMRGIKDALATGHRDAVPGLIRSMKRLWPETSGLVRRREDEARLFEQGLKNG
jgi:GH24 family phage-related lysozyme (muramidase)